MPADLTAARESLAIWLRAQAEDNPIVRDRRLAEAEEDMGVHLRAALAHIDQIQENAAAEQRVTDEACRDRDRFRDALDAIRRAHDPRGSCLASCASWSEDYRINDCNCGYIDAADDAGGYAATVLRGES